MAFSKQDIAFKLIFIILGLALGVASHILPVRLVFMLIIGIGGAIFTFVNIRLSFCLFIVGMSIIPYSMWSNMYLLLAAVFYWGVFIIQYFSGKRDGIDTRFVAPSLVLYIIFCIISFFTGFGGMDSIRVASIMFSTIALGVLATNVIDDMKEFKTVIAFIFVGLLLSALYGLLQYSTGIAVRADFVDLALNPGLRRLYATMGNPNNYAEFLIMLLPFCVSYIFISKGDFRKLFFIALVVPIFLALMLTFSRASYLALIGVVAMYIIMIKPRLIPMGIALSILSIPFIPDAIIMRMSTLGTDTSSLYRIWIWEGAIRVVQNYWAQGIGIGPQAFNLIYRAHAHQSAGAVVHAHNVFLNVWIEVGIGGFIAIIIYNFKTLRGGISAFLHTTDNEVKHFLAAGVSALVGFLIFSVVEHVWFHPRIMLAYWLMMGLIWAIIKIDGGKRA